MAFRFIYLQTITSPVAHSSIGTCAAAHGMSYHILTHVASDNTLSAQIYIFPQCLLHGLTVSNSISIFTGFIYFSYGLQTRWIAANSSMLHRIIRVHVYHYNMFSPRHQEVMLLFLGTKVSLLIEINVTGSREGNFIWILYSMHAG